MRNNNKNIKVVSLAFYSDGLLYVVDGGEIRNYIKRGVHKLSERQLKRAMEDGEVPLDYKKYREFPTNYRLEIEEPKGLDKRVTVTVPKKYNQGV